MIDVLTAELHAPLTEQSAELYVGGTVFKTGPPCPAPGATRPHRPAHPQRLTEAPTAPDPLRPGRLDTEPEPGGQLEPSSPPAPHRPAPDRPLAAPGEDG